MPCEAQVWMCVACTVTEYTAQRSKHTHTEYTALVAHSTVFVLHSTSLVEPSTALVSTMAQIRPTPPQPKCWWEDLLDANLIPFLYSGRPWGCTLWGFDSRTPRLLDVQQPSDDFEQRRPISTKLGLVRTMMVKIGRCPPNFGRFRRQIWQTSTATLADFDGIWPVSSNFVRIPRPPQILTKFSTGVCHFFGRFRATLGRFRPMLSDFDCTSLSKAHRF